MALTVSSGPPANTVVTHADIQVILQAGTILPADVKIVVTDAAGTHTAVDSKQYGATASYPVKVTTVGSQEGLVETYVDGALASSQMVPPPPGSPSSSSGAGGGAAAPGSTSSPAPGASGSGSGSAGG